MWAVTGQRCWQLNGQMKMGLGWALMPDPGRGYTTISTWLNVGWPLWSVSNIETAKVLIEGNSPASQKKEREDYPVQLSPAKGKASRS